MLDKQRLEEWSRVAAIEFATEAEISYVCTNIETFDIFDSVKPEHLDWFVDCPPSDYTYERICMANLLLGAV